MCASGLYAASAEPRIVATAIASSRRDQASDAMERLRSTVAEAVAVLKALPHEKLGERRTIQKHWDLTVLEAIYHVVEHFSMHTGQIIFATKLLTGSDLGFYGYLKSKTP